MFLNKRLPKFFSKTPPLASPLGFASEGGKVILGGLEFKNLSFVSSFEFVI